MVSRWSVGAFLVVGMACGAGCSWQPNISEQSIHDLPGVYYIGAEEWFESRTKGQPHGIGWVQLPYPGQHQPYVSGIDPFVKGFVRPEVCGECHAEIHESILKTAHFRTAEEATKDTVLGSFAPGKNELKTRDPNLRFKMVADRRGLFQRLSVRRDSQHYTLEVRMDISTGSGNHGQSYLYWHGDELYELPVSYFSERNRWVNSPGLYADGTADFARAIGDRCLDCHATFFAVAPNTFNRYDRTNYILGVTCVRCHGPGWAHVQYHRHHPDDSQARYIVHPAQLSLQRANEVCAQCHSGAGQLHQPAFTYHPGEPLEKYIRLDFSDADSENDDPHAANQLARLMKSRCFKESDNLTCFKCHDPHTNERGDMALFARRCAQCHETGDCRLSAELGSELDTRCIVCHMPSRRDAQGVMETPEGDLLPLLRDHYIEAKPAATQQIVEELRAELLKRKRKQ